MSAPWDFTIASRTVRSFARSARHWSDNAVECVPTEPGSFAMTALCSRHLMSADAISGTAMMSSW